MGRSLGFALALTFALYAVGGGLSHADEMKMRIRIDRQYSGDACTSGYLSVDNIFHQAYIRENKRMRGTDLAKLGNTGYSFFLGG